MKFITEEDLRDLYKKAPYNTYELEPGTRLTPGARQFLVDKGMMTDFDDFNSRKKFENNKQTENSANTLDINKRKDQKLLASMKSIEAMFFLTEQELLTIDIDLAQSLIELRKQFTNIKNSIKTREKIESLRFTECSGIKSEQFSCNIGDCFEIAEFHIQLVKGRQITLLHRLRSLLQEIEPLVFETYQGKKEQDEIQELIIEKVNQIINILSQMICVAVGGKKCQRLE